MRWCLLLLAACGRLDFGELADARGDDAAADGSVPELCNGIDDNGDGRIDEGCPCTPFSVSSASELFGGVMISTGTDWFVQAGTHLDRIDGDTGAIVDMIAFDPTSPPSGWDGHELVALSSGALQLVALDGTIISTGPATGLDATPLSLFDWTGNGFDVLALPLAASMEPDQLEYVHTDAAGTPLTAVATSSVYEATFPRALGMLGGVPAVAARVDDPSFPNTNRGIVALLTPPAPITFATIVEGLAPTSAASDGTRFLMTDYYGDVYVIDATTATKISGLVVDPHGGSSVVRASDGWEVVYGDIQTLYRIHVNADLTFGAPEMISNLIGVSSGTVPLAIGDARRALTAFTSNPAGTEMGYLVQVCD